MHTKNKKFYWGASTASHQVDGDSKNQWTIWEKANAENLAKTAKKRLKWMPGYQEIAKEAENPDNYISGKGVDHYNRYTEDFDILTSLNLNAFRFGIDWSKLEPRQGEWDEAAVAHYHDYIDALLERNVEPFVNLWHWTNPVWFNEMGGFEKAQNIKYFKKFVDKVVNEYGGKINYIITINEPNVYSGMSYATGVWPPNRKNLYKTVTVMKNLASAHIAAYKIIKNRYKHIQVGAASQLANAKPNDHSSRLDWLAVKKVNFYWNWWWLDRIRKHQDFVGFNYYFTDYYRGFTKHNPKEPLNDMGWYMEPRGILDIMRKISKRYKGTPIIVTENGVADKKDQYRKWWLQETMNAIDEAKYEGIPLIGYLHWSLLDNFEWDSGWWPKFGLVEVNRNNDMKRTIRPSAKWWARQIELTTRKPRIHK